MQLCSHAVPFIFFFLFFPSCQQQPLASLFANPMASAMVVPAMLVPPPIRVPTTHVIIGACPWAQASHFESDLKFKTHWQTLLRFGLFGARPAQSIVWLHGGHTHPPYCKCQDKH